MGFGGATQAMITAIRNNKNLLSNNKARHNDLKKRHATYTNGVQHKEFSAQDIKIAKQRIRQEAKKEKLKSKIVLIITVIVTPITLYILGNLFYKLITYQ